MSPNAASALIEKISAAVTPVVMISAAAALILGINQKHAALAERMRALAVEFRAPGSTEERRAVIREQMHLFERRIGYVALAHLWLYMASVCFVGMVLVITLGPQRGIWDQIALGLFVVGITLVLGAVLAELTELRLAGRTIRLEIEDILASTASEQDLGRGNRKE